MACRASHWMGIQWWRPMPMIGRMMACGTSSSAVMANSVANQSPTRLEMRLMVCFIPRFLS